MIFLLPPQGFIFSGFAATSHWDDKCLFALGLGFSRVESNACALWSSDPALGIPTSSSSSTGMICVRSLLRPTIVLWNSCRGWIKRHVNPLSFLQLRQCCYPGEIMWNGSIWYLHVISVPASDAEQTQNNVWCGIDSHRAKSEWSLSSIATFTTPSCPKKSHSLSLYGEHQQEKCSVKAVSWNSQCFRWEIILIRRGLKCFINDKITWKIDNQIHTQFSKDIFEYGALLLIYLLQKIWGKTCLIYILYKMSCIKKIPHVLSKCYIEGMKSSLSW